MNKFYILCCFLFIFFLPACDVDNKNEAALYSGITNGDLEKVRVLLNQKEMEDLDTNAAAELLKAAVDAQNQGVLQLLLENGFSPDARIDVFFEDKYFPEENRVLQVPLIVYVADHDKGCDVNLLNTLISHGADVNSEVIPKSQTALFGALFQSDFACTEILVRNHADIGWKDINGKGVIAEAMLSGDMAILELLIGAGANIDSVDNNGVSPLMVGTVGGYLSAVKLLLEHGANVCSTTRKNRKALIVKEGETASDMAKRHRYKDIYNILLKEEKRQNC